MTRAVRVGNIVIGGGAPVTVQSMTTVRTADAEACARQALALARSGCDIVRVAVRDEADARAIGEIKKSVSVPIVADIHFDYKLAIAAVESGADKIRINPGNIGGEARIRAVADCLKANRVPVRVGANTGSIEKAHYEKYGRSAEALVESALANARLLEKQGAKDIVVSVKASSVPLTVEAYRLLSARCDYPLHLGVTEAGTYESGLVKSAAGIGALLLAGIGDTLRVSLADDPVKEGPAGRSILRAVGLESDYVEVVSCPTCGRCDWDSPALARRVEAATAGVRKRLKVAVMGCVVNGPGEARDADIGIAGSAGVCVLFKRGVPVRKIEPERAEEEFLAEIYAAMEE